MTLAHARLIITAAIMVLAMVISGALGLRQMSGIVLLALISLAWLTVDKLWEGPVLLPLGHGHGIVAADLVGLAGLVGAVLLLLRRGRS